MIHVEIRTGDSPCLRLTGHAGYAEKGSDIVCSAATILAYAAANAVCSMAEDGLLMSDPLVRLEEGDIEIACEPLPCEQPRMDRILECIIDTYAQLGLTYPEHVQITPVY